MDIYRKTVGFSRLLWDVAAFFAVIRIISGIAGIILWGIVHDTFVRPFVLVGVLRNTIESGMQEVPSEASFAMLDSKSARFRKLHAELA